MTEITIPVEGVKLDGNTVYKLKGLEASMTYEVTLTSDKFVNLEITEDEDEQAKVLATYKTATGSNGWSGKAVISYLGPIS